MEFRDEFAGLTVKQVLTDELSFSRKAITALKAREDGILINGTHATVRAIIKSGDTLTINYDDQETDSEKLPPSSCLPEIIYEDEHIVAANKPPYMPTHQSHGHFDDTLANSLAYHYSLIGHPFVFRAVNRLDRNTSGVVLVAKDKISASRLSHSMIRGDISKTYLAILDGELQNECGEIRAYIRRQSSSIITRCVCSSNDEGARAAITEYEVLARGDGMTLVIARPITGRTHQLRVHFSSVGAPILGDDLYGRSSELISRHALHAVSISFPHPSDGHRTELRAPIPDDMNTIIKKYFKGAIHDK